MSTTLSASTLLAVPMAPLLGAVLVGIFGTRLGGNWFGRRLCHSIAIFGVLVSFLLSVSVLLDVIDGARFNDSIYEWMVIGGLTMEIGFMVDGLTAMMMVVVTFVSLMVHLYTIGYMQEDEGYNRFFAYISLFTFSMLMLVMSNNLLQLFFAWEAVGLVSYLLIGFWYKRPTAIFANMKAFLVNRVGDFGFLLGIALIAAYTGSLNYSEIFAKLPELATVEFPWYILGQESLLVTVIAICLFIGAMGKSAQFPLHVWLPDSMEGPTPISALIHAATMVTAGIFMVARMSPVFELSDAALNFILIIGAITALFMGLLGMVQNDIKRVVAYSTLSQLGYMTVALGASAYSVALFHLMTHAFFKALLFLAAGSVIMGLHHNQDMRWMGGLRKYMPITWITALLGTLALVGMPLFSGYYSKEAIKLAADFSALPAATFAYYALLAGVFVTSFYSFRLYFMVFHGPERYHLNPDAHHAAHDGDHGHHGHDEKPHESPWVVTVPLLLLAVPSVVIGYLTIGPMLFGDFLADAVHVNHVLHPAMTELAAVYHGPPAFALKAFSSIGIYLAIAGALLAWYLYLHNTQLAGRIAQALRPLVVVLENKYYLDWFNEKVLARGTMALGWGFWKGGDRGLIEAGVVNMSWKLIGRVAAVVRHAQTGYLYHYAFVMIVGVLALMTYFVWR